MTLCSERRSYRRSDSDYIQYLRVLKTRPKARWLVETGKPFCPERGRAKVTEGGFAAPSAMSFGPGQHPGGFGYLLFELRMWVCGEQDEATAEGGERVAMIARDRSAMTMGYSGLGVHVAHVKCGVLACSWAVLTSTNYKLLTGNASFSR